MAAFFIGLGICLLLKINVFSFLLLYAVFVLLRRYFKKHNKKDMDDEWLE